MVLKADIFIVLVEAFSKAHTSYALMHASVAVPIKIFLALVLFFFKELCTTCI